MGDIHLSSWVLVWIQTITLLYLFLSNGSDSCQLFDDIRRRNFQCLGQNQTWNDTQKSQYCEHYHHWNAIIYASVYDEIGNCNTCATHDCNETKGDYSYLRRVKLGCVHLEKAELYRNQEIDYYDCNQYTDISAQRKSLSITLWLPEINENKSAHKYNWEAKNSIAFSFHTRYDAGRNDETQKRW